MCGILAVGALICGILCVRAWLGDVLCVRVWIGSFLGPNDIRIDKKYLAKCGPSGYLKLLLRQESAALKYFTFSGDTFNI